MNFDLFKVIQNAHVHIFPVKFGMGKEISQTATVTTTINKVRQYSYTKVFLIFFYISFVSYSKYDFKN